MNYTGSVGPAREVARIQEVLLVGGDAGITRDNKGGDQTAARSRSPHPHTGTFSDTPGPRAARIRRDTSPQNTVQFNAVVSSLE